MGSGELAARSVESGTAGRVYAGVRSAAGTGTVRGSCRFWGTCWASASESASSEGCGSGARSCGTDADGESSGEGPPNVTWVGGGIGMGWALALEAPGA